MDTLEERQTRLWVEAWRENSALLDEVKVQELRALTEEEAGRMFVEMAIDTDTIWISPERGAAAGLIEQQRLFLRSHEHPACHHRRA